MLLYGVEFTGLTGEELQRRAAQVRPALAKAMRSPMREFRKRMVSSARTRYGKKTGRTVENLRKGRISTDVQGSVVRGRLTHRAMFLNILEPGASLPAMTIRARKGKALRFIGNDGQPHFAALVHLPARTIPPRPITRPALDSVLPVVRLKLASTVERVVAEGRRDEIDAAE